MYLGVLGLGNGESEPVPHVATSPVPNFVSRPKAGGVIIIKLGTRELAHSRFARGLYGTGSKAPFLIKIPFKIADFWGRFRPRLASGENATKRTDCNGVRCCFERFLAAGSRDPARPGPAAPATQIQRGRYHFSRAFNASNRRCPRFLGVFICVCAL